jgi:Na+/H+ antiporter NhaA
MRWRDVFVLGIAASIGFTVALFISTVAFKPTGANEKFIGLALDAAKLGALISFVGFILTYVVGKAVGVKKVQPGQELD